MIDDLIHDLDRSDEAFLVDMTNRTPGGRVVRQEGLLLAIGAVPSPTIVNTIVPVAPVIDPDAMDRAVAVYRELGHMTGVWTRDHLDADLATAMETRAYHPLLRLPVMILRDRPATEPIPDGAEIHRVETEDDRRQWLESNLDGFAEDDGDREAMRSAIGTVESLAGTSDVGSMAGFYALADGEPAAAAVVFVDSATRIGIIGWVGTNRAFRRRGLGRAVTLAATIAGFDLGARLVQLQASPMGLPLYEKMGFETVGGVRIWLAPG